MPAIDAMLNEVKLHLAVDDPVLATIHDLMSAETIATGDPIRVADLLPVVGILKARLGPEPQGVPSYFISEPSRQDADGAVVADSA